MLSYHPSGPRSEDENGVVGGSHQRNQVRQLQFDMYPCVDLNLFIRGKFYLSKLEEFPSDGRLSSPLGTRACLSRPASDFGRRVLEASLLSIQVAATATPKFGGMGL